MTKVSKSLAPGTLSPLSNDNFGIYTNFRKTNPHKSPPSFGYSMNQLLESMSETAGDVEPLLNEYCHEQVGNRLTLKIFKYGGGSINP